MNNSVKNSFKTFKKVAAILAVLLGLMSVFAGSKVLLGLDNKDYTILSWLVGYNVLFGLISIYTAYTLWYNQKNSTFLTVFILDMHFMVFVYLKFISSTAADESIKAMIFRTSIWIIIAILTLLIPYTLKKIQK